MDQKDTCKAAARAMALADGKWLYIGGSGEGAPYDPAQGNNDSNGQQWGKNQTGALQLKGDGTSRAVVSVGTYLRDGDSVCHNMNKPG